MTKYISRREKNLKVGIKSYSENVTSLEVIGKVGIGTTNAQNHSLFVVGSTNVTGDIVVSGASTFVGVSTFRDDVYIQNDLYVDGVNINNLVGEDIVTRNILVTGVSTFTGISTSLSAIFGKQLTISGVTTTNSLSIGPTQVISSARELQNIASLDSTTTATIESAIANAPNTFTNIEVTGISTLGITTTTDLTAQKLNVSGISTFVDGPVSIGAATSTGTALQRLQVTGGAYVSGNLGIGSESPSSKLYVVGDVLITGIVTATDINSSSDIRLKKNIKKFENTLEKINEINGVSFEWKQSDSKSAGVIAQELEKVFPELVINTSEYKKVNYNGLIGVLVESIKDLKKEIDDLKVEVKYLKDK